MNMNLFHQLESQAIEYARSVCNSAGNCIVYDDGKEVVFTFHEVIRQKLAELIIQECIEQVKLELGTRGQLLTPSSENAGVWFACNNIRRHFGVE